MHLLVLLLIQNDASDSGAICRVSNDDVKSFVAIKLQAATNIEEQSRKSPKPTGESIAEEHVIAKSSNAINREKCLVEKRDVLGRISPDPEQDFSLDEVTQIRELVSCDVRASEEKAPPKYSLSVSYHSVLIVVKEAALSSQVTASPRMYTDLTLDPERECEFLDF